MAEMLDKAKLSVENELQDDMRLQGKLLCAIAETYRGLGLFEKSLTTAKRSHDTLAKTLGPKHLDTINSLESLAHSYRDSDRAPLRFQCSKKHSERERHNCAPNTSIQRLPWAIWRVAIGF